MIYFYFRFSCYHLNYIINYLNQSHALLYAIFCSFVSRCQSLENLFVNNLAFSIWCRFVAAFFSQLLDALLLEFDEASDRFFWSGGVLHPLFGDSGCHNWGWSLCQVFTQISGSSSCILPILFYLLSHSTLHIPLTRQGHTPTLLRLFSQLFLIPRLIVFHHLRINLFFCIRKPLELLL